MIRTILTLCILLSVSLVATAQTGTITNISVQPRTDGSGMLDVHFNLSGEAASYNILMEVSFDAGDTYTPIPTAYLSGDLQGISPGNRHVVWDGYGSFPQQFSTQTRIKIVATADDNGGGNGDWPIDSETEVVEVLNPATGKTWMDRNLGASRAATSSTDAEAYGDLYQWGRAADGHQKRTSGTTSTLSNSDTPGHGDFILAPDSPRDWRSPQNTNLWQGVNSINNPCPAGYRLPTEAELNTERLSWSSNDAVGAFASPLNLPVAGYRYCGNGWLSLDGYGNYWSSTVDGNFSRNLGFFSSNGGVSSNRRAQGFSVRCLKDGESTYILNMNLSPEGSGQVSGAGEYGEGSTVNITAIPNSNYQFVNWSGDTNHIADANASYTTVTITPQDITLTANFETIADNGEWLIDTITEVIEVLNPATGKTWMDRNLGASRAATSSTDAEAYGDLYQWGRAADGHQIRTSSTTTTLSNSDTPEHNNFILAPNTPHDWRSSQNNNLWQGVNGTNNPCPSGYRLPSEAEWRAELNSWNSPDANGAFASPLKLPMAGFRISSDGSLFDVGSRGDYFSSTVDGNRSLFLLFISSYAYINSYFRAHGTSVRCLKD